MQRKKQSTLSGEAMQQKIQQILNVAPYKMHVIVEDYKTGNIPISTGANEVFSSASVIKVPILIAILHHLQQNSGNLQQVISIASEMSLILVY
jgi:beta-lactamase class A